MEIDEFASQDTEALISKKLKHNEEAMTKDFGKCSTVDGSTSGSLISDNVNSSKSDLLYHDDNDDDVAVHDDNVAAAADDVSNYEDDDGEYMYDYVDDDDDYLSLQAQFDNVDLPPGVEASVAWLKDPVPSASVSAAFNISTLSDALSYPSVAGTSSSLFPDLANAKKEASASNSTAVLAQLSSDKKENEDQVMMKFQHFRRFDTVDQLSDHHFMGLSVQQPSKDWTKRIQEEWKILEKDLPDTIYVRVCETRMDLLRAVIVGPAGTPYHDGLFVFDILFPPTYPDIPPMVYYYSGGLRLNPNLYDCGKVCLSLLNTWSGDKNEMWMPKKSTMLQVLVSIQALILNSEPFFNEPGFAKHYVGAEGERRSNEYNEDVFILSLKTMVYTLRRPPKHFEDYVVGHFRLHAHDILSACKSYMEGAQIGSVVRGTVQETNDAEPGHRSDFITALGKMMNILVTSFTRNGSEDCEQFQLPG